jgi:hypothetical protein
MKKIYRELSNKWKKINFDPLEFSKFLKDMNWEDLNKNCKNGVFKRVFTNGKIVVKFNEEEDSKHTFSEYRSWLSSGLKRRDIMCPPLYYHKGLLFQPLLKNVYNGKMEDVPREVHILARKFKFSHYWNYGFMGDKIKFFDTDGLYYQLTDKEERVY